METSNPLIIGAGPTGLTLACELRRRGIDVRLIDQESSSAAQSRALGLQARTLEIFEKMGVIDEILKKGLKVRRGTIYREGKQMAHIDFSSLNTPYPFLLILPQSDTEEILSQHYAKQGGVIERSVTLTGLDHGCALLKSKREEKIRPRWILGCDGAHSTVRKALNLPFKGTRFPETFVLADIFIDSPLATDQTHLFFGKKGMLGFIPLPKKGVFRLISIVPPSQKNALDQVFLQHLIEEHTTSRQIHIKQILWTSLFHIHRRIAPQMRCGNVFLLGDAAHIHSPAGGQGLNTSVQDAYNLAWKLALVDQGFSPDSLLDSYQDERGPVAQAVLKGTTRATQFIRSTILQKLLFPLLRIALCSQTVKKKLANAISELNVHYRASPIVFQTKINRGWKGPKPGERAPNAPLSQGRDLFALLSVQQHVLLCFGLSNLSSLQEELTRLYGNLILVYPLSSIESSMIDIYHAYIPCLYLIRPDGYIAYRSQEPTFESFSIYLKKIFLC
jgi:2-polyprenyl-6-methoxyphenol hydroxylase-like FAD-dependent oxidoreductase